MVKNYLLTALRILASNRIYSFVNILGLTVGLSACMIVATVVIDDLSYDRQWSRSKDLYRILSDYKLGPELYDRSSSSFAGLGGELKKNFPEVEAVAEIRADQLRLKFDEADRDGVMVGSLNADTTVWSLLDIAVVSGNPRKYVDGQSNLLISETMRDKFFQGRNPIGAMINEVSGSDETPTSYLITGVFRDLPANTHLRADVLTIRKKRIESLSRQNEGTFLTQYALMRPGTDMKKFSAMVNKWYNRYITKDNQYGFAFQPMKDVYLHSDFDEYQNVKGSIRNINIFSGVAVLLLLIACINFINLSTARASTRMRETGVRKILGAQRRHIIFQFLAESILYFSISSLIAALIYQLSLPFVERYLGHTLVQTFLSHVSLFLYASGMILMVCFFTGIYPAWLLSGFKPANALRGKSLGTGSAWLRKSLVVVQFSISIVVLVALATIQQQVQFMKNADVGFNKKGLLSINRISWDGKAEIVKNETRSIPGVEQCSITSFSPSMGGGFMSTQLEDPNHGGHKITAWYILGDIDFAETVGLRLKSGRMLSRDLSTDVANDDSIENIILQPSMITASTAKLLNIKTLNTPEKGRTSVPVGIVEDFHNESFKKPLGAVFILADRAPKYGVMLIRVKPGAEKLVMPALQQIWKKYYPSKLVEANWVEDLLDRQYAEEDKLQQLFSFFSLLAMGLAALGIFGLVVHAAGLRVKEIGVRKVLGASVVSIVRLLSSDFIKLVAVAILIASPLAWWLMNKWLEDYAYRIHISWMVFALTGGITLLVALITVSLQAIKSAIANPVNSLRAE